MKDRTFRHIFKASAIIGSSSVITILSGIIKTKVIAIFLGPVGIGLFGLLFSIQTTAGTIAGMGLANSGARECSIAQAENNVSLLALTRRALNFSALFFGGIGALIIILFREKLSQISFGGGESALQIAIISIGVFALAINGSQTALLNGLQKIKEFAKVNIYGNIFGGIVGLVAVWLCKDSGVVVAIVAVPVISALVAWKYCKKLAVCDDSFAWSQVFAQQKKLVGLGFVFMSTALMTSATQFLVRIILTKTCGIASTGQFQAAWNISMFYLGFVLGAMATDYYPRLSAVSNDSQQTNAMVNDQSEVAFLLTGPVILLTITMADFIIRVLYTAEFTVTTDILRWQVLGDVFKVATWPLGYVLFAKGMSKIVFLAELSWNLVYLLLVVVGTKLFGIEATGIAFLMVYVYYFFLIWFLVYRSTRFKWSNRNLRTLGMLSTASFIIFGLHYVAPVAATLVGVTLTLIMGLLSAKKVYQYTFTNKRQS